MMFFVLQIDVSMYVNFAGLIGMASFKQDAFIGLLLVITGRGQDRLG